MNWGFTSDNMKMVYGDALFVGWVSRRQSVRIMFPFKSCFEDCIARKAERETCSWKSSGTRLKGFCCTRHSGAKLSFAYKLTFPVRPQARADRNYMYIARVTADSKALNYFAVFLILCFSWVELVSSFHYDSLKRKLFSKYESFKVSFFKWRRIWGLQKDGQFALIPFLNRPYNLIYISCNTYQNDSATARFAFRRHHCMIDQTVFQLFLS